MKKNRIIALVLALAMLIASLATLSSCVTPDETDDGAVNYKVTVTDGLGAPMPGIIVNVFKDGEFIEMKMTNKNGVASASPEGLPDGTYTVEIVDPLGNEYVYDTESAVITPENEEITVVLYSGTESLHSEMIYPADAENGIKASALTNGGYRVKLSAGKNYFIFAPNMRGEYLIKAEAPVEADLTYHGAPHFVQDDASNPEGEGDVYENKDGLVFLVRSFNVGEDYFSSSRYVFSVTVPSECVANVVITYDAELEMSREEIPWSDVGVSGEVKKYVLPGTENWDPDAEDANQTRPVIPLESLDLTDKNLIIVYNSEDKCYHVGTEDGPVVLMRLTTASEYIASFSEMMSTAHFGVYLYDGDKLLEKRDYTDLLSKYCEAADAAYGLYPLNDDLIDFVKTIGDCWGWFTVGGANNLFGDKATKIVPELAHLFACCYISE